MRLPWGTSQQNARESATHWKVVGHFEISTTVFSAIAPGLKALYVKDLSARLKELAEKVLFVRSINKYLQRLKPD